LRRVSIQRMPALVHTSVIQVFQLVRRRVPVARCCVVGCPLLLRSNGKQAAVRSPRGASAEPQARLVLRSGGTRQQAWWSRKHGGLDVQGEGVSFKAAAARCQAGTHTNARSTPKKRQNRSSPPPPSSSRSSELGETLKVRLVFGCSAAPCSVLHASHQACFQAKEEPGAAGRAREGLHLKASI